jgi:hypothetical protein
MVAKIKSSFLKNSFQLFCYKNFLNKDSSNGPPSSNSNNEVKRSQSSNSIISMRNDKEDKNSLLADHQLEESAAKKRPTTPNNSSDLESTNSTIRNEYYMNNRKQLSKILNGKLRPEDFIQPNSNGGKKSHQHQHQYLNNPKGSKSSSDEMDSFDLGTKKPVMTKSATLPINNMSLASISSDQTTNTVSRHSFSLSNESQAKKKQPESSPDAKPVASSFKSDLSNPNGSNLYRNQSIAGLKLAKKMQLMNKLNSTNANNGSNTMTLSNKSILNSVGRNSNGVQTGRGPHPVHKPSGSILSSDAHRRSLSASAHHHNAKKAVRFADSLGLELESIITLNNQIPVNMTSRNFVNSVSFFSFFSFRHFQTSKSHRLINFDDVFVYDMDSYMSIIRASLD